MRKKITNLLLLVLAAVMLLGGLAACGGNTDPTPGGETGTQQTGNGSSTWETETQPASGSKLIVYDWDRDFDIAGYNIEEGYSAGLWVEAPDDTVSTLIYSRNAFIEENYGITVTYDSYALGTNDDLALVDLVKKDTMTGKSKYELIACNFGECSRLLNSTETYLSDLYDHERFPWLDFDNPCWDQSAHSQLQINNRLYMMTGDLNLTEKKNIGLLMYNRNLLMNYGGSDAEDELTDMVRDGAWTLSEMAIMVKDAATLDSGTGEVRTYGLCVRNNRSFYYYIAGCGVRVADKDDNDIPYLVIDNEKTLTVVDKLLEFCSLPKYTVEKDGTCFYARYSGDFTKAENTFLNNNALFYGADLKDVDTFKGKTIDFTYGYLPYPKFNSSQENYLASINPYFSTILVIPDIVSDSVFASFGLQALGEGSPKITRQFVEVYCKIRGTLDDLQYDMLSIALEHVTYDPGVVYNWGNVYMGIFVDGYHSEIDGVEYEAIAVSGTNNFKTLWEAYRNQVEEALKQFLKNVK